MTYNSEIPHQAWLYSKLYRVLCKKEKQEITIFWNTQTTTSHANNHAMVSHRDHIFFHIISLI